jgi:hypothetical protein
MKNRDQEMDIPETGKCNLASRQGSNDVRTLGDQGILRRLIATTMIMMLWWMMMMMRWKVTTMMMTKGGYQHKHIPSICVASSNTILGQEQRYDICRSEEGTKVRCIFEIIYYILDISGSGRR